MLASRAPLRGTRCAHYYLMPLLRRDKKKRKRSERFWYLSWKRQTNDMGTNTDTTYYPLESESDGRCEGNMYSQEYPQDYVDTQHYTEYSHTQASYNVTDPYQSNTYGNTNAYHYPEPSYEQSDHFISVGQPDLTTNQFGSDSTFSYQPASNIGTQPDDSYQSFGSGPNETMSFNDYQSQNNWSINSEHMFVPNTEYASEYSAYAYDQTQQRYDEMPAH